MGSSTLDSSDVASISDPGPLEETAARGSADSPCRAFHPLTHPRDGREPHDEALSSGEFPTKPEVIEWGGVDEMGPWLRVHSTDSLLLSRRMVHMSTGCPFLSSASSSLTLCYCVDKLHRCFHYDVDDHYCLHANSRCSENVDMHTGWIWPVVIMCRWCCPFRERPQ